MKNQVRRLLSLLIIMLLLVIGFAKELPVQQVHASVSSDELAHTYLNVITKYLVLGKTGKNKFDFNINKEALQKGATYSWYIKADKGNPKAVTIDSKTGVVTAKSIGTAYIRCKITLENKKVLRPEAKVIIENNITAVEINNIPEDRTLIVGQTMDFNSNILNTGAGKDATASGITRWEIKSDTAGVGNVTEDGIVVPQNAGAFSIRTVCFKSLNEYKLWLANKEANKDSITAASSWVTIMVIATSAEAATQEQLNELLGTENITQITLSTKAELKIKIPEGDYSDKTLIMNAPNTDITNYGVFKLIVIKSATQSMWVEYAINNSLVVYDSDIRLVITQKSQVKSVEFGMTSAAPNTANREQNINTNEAQIQSFESGTDIVLVNLVDLTVDGKLDELYIQATSKLILSGSGYIDQFIIKENSNGTMIATTVKINLFANSNFIITLLKGSENSTISFPKNTTSTIENLTSSNVDIQPGKGFILSTPGWALYFLPNGSNTVAKITTSSVIKFTPVLESAVTGSAIYIGQTLWFSILNGSFTFNSTKVEGVLSWEKPETVVKNNGVFSWVFIPLDSSHYSTVTGFTSIIVIEEIIPVLNATKTAIEAADYSNIRVTDTSNASLKLLVIQSIIQRLKGLTTVEVIWNSTSSAYDVTISYYGQSTTTSITSATFVNQ